jgi:phosphoglycolate phosphatase
LNAEAAGTPSRLIVFDLDGTLVDSRRDLADSANALLVECGGAPLPEEAIGRMIGDGAAVLVARVFESARHPAPPDALSRFLAIYNRRLLKFTRAYPGISEALDALKSRARLAVLTNKPLEATREVLSGLDLARYFPSDLVLGGDGNLPRKPDPAGLLWLMRRTAIRSRDTTMVGDSVVDWRTARAANTRVCLTRYGFGFEGFPSDQLSPDDQLIDDPAQLVHSFSR